MLTFAAMATEVELKEQPRILRDLESGLTGIAQAAWPGSINAGPNQRTQWRASRCCGRGRHRGGHVCWEKCRTSSPSCPSRRLRWLYCEPLKKSSGVTIELGELERQAEKMNMKLADLLKQVARETGEVESGEREADEEGEFETIPAEEDRLRSCRSRANRNAFH